jgi:4-hydroxybenzoate polyprenyltransferase
MSETQLNESEGQIRGVNVGNGTSCSELPIVVNIQALAVGDLAWELRWKKWRQSVLEIKKREESEQPGPGTSLDSIPWREDVLQFLKSESERGRKIFLLSIPGTSLAEAIAPRLNATVLAPDVCSTGSDGSSSGQSQPAIFGSGYVYASQYFQNDPWWRNAKAAIVIERRSKSRKSSPQPFPPIEREFFMSLNSVGDILKQLRVHQWTKNLLVLIPVAAAHRWTDGKTALATLMAFACFSLISSAVYLANDLLDLFADRAHTSKRHRPMASGRVSIPAGLFLFLATLACSAGILLLLPVEAAICAAAYCVATMAYSIHLKTFLALDVVMLAFFYTIRLLFGGAATGIEISIWTLAFSLFIFLSLALAKRASELDDSSVEFSGKGRRRPYRAADRPALLAQASASAYTALLVLGLYIHSPEVHAVYARSKILWLAIPGFVYWISRFLLIVQRGELHQDPVVFALRDPASWVVLCYVLALVLVAK